MRAKGNTLIELFVTPSFLALQGKVYLVRNLVGSSLPLYMGDFVLPILVLALTLRSLFSYNSSTSYTTSSLISTIFLGVLRVGLVAELG